MQHLLPAFPFHNGSITPCKAFIAMALVFLFGAVYQSWFPHESTSLWFSLSFSQASFALQSQPSRQSKSNGSSEPFSGHEMERALPSALLQPSQANSEFLPCGVNGKACLPHNTTSKYGFKPSDTDFPFSEHQNTAPDIGENEILTNQLRLESFEKRTDAMSVNSTSSDNGEDDVNESILENSEEKVDTRSSNLTSSDDGEGEAPPDDDILKSSERKTDIMSLNSPSPDNGEDKILQDEPILKNSQEKVVTRSLNFTSSDIGENEASPDDPSLESSDKKAGMMNLNSTSPIAVEEEQLNFDTNSSVSRASGLLTEENDFTPKHLSPVSPLIGNAALDNVISWSSGSSSTSTSVNNSKDLSPVANVDKIYTQGIYPEDSPIPSKKPRWVRKLEDDLLRAKEVIANATSLVNLGLYPPVYHNITKFVKSYKMMEQIFRVYTYHEGIPPLLHDGPTMGIYASEGRFIHGMQHSHKFTAKDPKEAHMFFLPYSVVNMVAELYVPGSRSMLPLATFIKDYVNSIAAKYPYWNRTRGADHFFVSCHDWGPATARDHQELRQNAMKVVCNADLTEEYVLEKDASLPEIYIHSSRRSSRVGGAGPGKRHHLAFFAGQMHGRVRPVLLQYWKDKDPDMKIFEVLPSSIAKKTSYFQYMKQSRFCICAMGYEVNSPRIVEAIYYDCVPVIIADNFVLPFSDVLNWEAFSVTLQERDIPKLKSILLSISDERYRAMQSRLKHVRRHFMWHKSPVKYDVFHMILHSVWLRRLHQI